MLNFGRILSKIYLYEIQKKELFLKNIKKEKKLNFNITINNENIAVEFIQSRRMKHCYIKILNASNIRIKANPRFSYDDAQMLIEKKYRWLEKHIVRLKQKELLPHEFCYLGKRYDYTKNFLNSDELDKFYKNKALEMIPAFVETHARRMNCHPTQVKFRKNRSRWGSCSSKNVINFNILLMKFPQSVIEYVVIHELAHIKHKNHSQSFWNFVEQFCPDYKEQERLLKLF